MLRNLGSSWAFRPGGLSGSPPVRHVMSACTVATRNSLCAAVGTIGAAMRGAYKHIKYIHITAQTQQLLAQALEHT